MSLCKISGENRRKYIDEALRNNRMLCTVASLFCIIVETFNVLRVLFLSDSGLGTVNNRIYFGFYIFLLICSIAYLIIGRRENGRHILMNRVCLIYASIVLLWNTCLNVYDIWGSDEIYSNMAATMLIAFSALVSMEPVYGLVNIWINYFVFMLAPPIYLFSGEGFNYTLTVLMASVICIIRFRHSCIELDQSQQIQEIGQKLNERRLWLTQKQYELISQNAGFITFQWDSENDRIVFSKNWKECFDGHYEIFHFHSYIKNSNLIDEDQKEKIERCIKDIKKGINYQNFELHLPAKGRKPHWFKVQVVRQEMNDKGGMHAVGFMNDITEEKERLLDLEKNAALDSFTGLLNKVSIDHYGKNWLKNLSAKGQKLAMMILDMDDFKNINDTYGHPCGDYVLKQVADLLLRYAPKDAKVGRLGGDEFIVLLETSDSTAHIYEYAEKVIHSVTDILWDGHKVQAKCSIGFAVTSEPGWSYEKLYKCADDALYTAKKNGKNRVWEAENRK